MALYFLKPVVWNDNGYRFPGGAKFTSGYPAEHGFGHEEWNNSDRLTFMENDQKLHIFHTEGFGNQPLAVYSDRIFVFMIASYRGDQYLVSVAGKATSLIDNEDERRRLVGKLKIDSLWEDLWKLRSIREKHENVQAFRDMWMQECKWVPTWICPANFYLEVNPPILLDPNKLTGRKRFITMYSSYQEIDKTLANRILDLIPENGKEDIVFNLMAICRDSSQDISDDIARIEDESSPETTKRALIDARVGQGKFRNDLLELWEGRCAVTGCSVVEVLRASHVKPWRQSSNTERLDPHNGLSLGAHLDALFDAGLISFEDDGPMLISKRVTDADRKCLRLGGRLRNNPSANLRKYLEHHRRYVARIE